MGGEKVKVDKNWRLGLESRVTRAAPATFPPVIDALMG